MGRINEVGDLILSLILQLAEAAILYAFLYAADPLCGEDIVAWVRTNCSLFKLSSGWQLVWGMSCTVVRWQFEFDFRRWLVWWYSAYWLDDLVEWKIVLTVSNCLYWNKCDMWGLECGSWRNTSSRFQWGLDVRWSAAWQPWLDPQCWGWHPSIQLCVCIENILQQLLYISKVNWFL